MSSVVALTELLELNTGGSAISVDNPLPVSPINVQTEFREDFGTYNSTTVWSQTTGSGDIVQLDGNAAGASYLVISKNPLVAGTETTVTTRATFTGPFETAVGLSMSQRTLGQETAIDFISTQTPTAPVADIAISSITQATTTLTVVTATAHGLTVGARIGIYGVASDSRFNYPSVVVATIVSATSFTVTAGPTGTITSVTAGPYTNQGYVYVRPVMGYAQNGMAEVLENASATNASFYIRENSGLIYPSGTFSGNQSVTIGTTVSVATATSAYTYAFVPTTEYRFILQQDKAQFYDASVDTTNQPTARLNRTTVLPTSTIPYVLCFRATNVKALPIPNGKITSAAKSGTTTTTITTETAHGLTTGDWVTVYGIGDTTNFPNVTTAVQVLSTPTTTTFTMIIAGAVTATSAGGLVSRQQGSLGIQGMQSTVAAQASSTTTQLTLVGSASWSLVIGDYVNVYGLRNRSTGADLGFDGAYKVVDQVTSTLVLEPLTGTTLPAPLTLTNTGGAVIKRTDTRINYARINQYLRERVEVLNKSDSNSGLPVVINSGTVSTVSSITAGSITPISSNTYSLVTSTSLGSSATFTQTAVNPSSSSTSSVQYFTQLVIGVSHTAGLVPGQLYLDVGTETSSTSPTTWYQQLAVPIPSNANWQLFSVPLMTRYYRLRFVNGATAQTNFRLATFQTYNGGALSNPYSFPINLQYPLSTTALAANGVFTSVTLDFGDTMNVYQTITAVAFADQASASNGFQIQISRDGTNWRTSQQTSVTASTLTTITAALVYRYARVVYTNGATLQGSFALDAQVDGQ